MSLSHDDLVECSARWLFKQRCVVVITEMTSGSSETPDAIGFTHRGSILVECKISKPDFKRDLKKWFRDPRATERGMGDARYYMVTEDVLPLAMEEAPEGWGVIVCRGRRGKGFMTRIWKRAYGISRADKRAEMGLLISALRRIDLSNVHAVSAKTYSVQTRNRASIGALPEDHDVPEVS